MAMCSAAWHGTERFYVLRCAECRHPETQSFNRGPIVGGRPGVMCNRFCARPCVSLWREFPQSFPGAGWPMEHHRYRLASSCAKHRALWKTRKPQVCAFARIRRSGNRKVFSVWFRILFPCHRAAPLSLIALSLSL